MNPCDILYISFCVPIPICLAIRIYNKLYVVINIYDIFDTLLSYIDTTDYSILTAPIWIKVIKNVTDSKNNVITTISWDAPPGGVDFYTFYYDDGRGECFNETLDSTITSQTVVNGEEIQIATHRNDMTKCSKGMYS